MALTSETQSSPKGVNCIEHESAESLNEADLEDGEIFEDEEPGTDAKVATVVLQEKPKPSQTPVSVVPTAQKKPIETVKNQRSLENNDKPIREQNVPFFNKAKRKHFDDIEEDEDNRWKRDGKRNRRSHEFERDGDAGRIRQDGELAEDDEEMMFVRGASPSRMDEECDKWDREGEEDDRHEMSRRPMRSYRGRGGISRRGDQRQRGRGRGRGGNMRGNKRKRDDADTCVFFLQGKCHRGSDCPYAHEILPPRKMELCKFYMKDCCAKKDKCLYMHSEFPCKYFHMGLKCYANKKCKFSHGQLNDTLRNILAKHLDTAPKDMLGEFPRRDQRDRGDMRDVRGDSRDRRVDPRDLRCDRDMRGDFMRNRNDRDRKIPSLFDIKVSIPDELRNADGNHTPMPSPTQRSQDSARSSDRDRDIYTPDREKERERERERDKEREREREHEKHKHEKSERSKEKKAKREKAREHRKERKERREKEKEKKRERSKDALSEKIELLEQDGNKSINVMSPKESEDNVKSGDEASNPTNKACDDQIKRAFSYEDNGLIPQHLPKKQRELFLRIQQQQREAESSQASANDDDEEEEKAAEENWYSSDEEAGPSAPLPTILHNLTQSAVSTATTTTAATVTSASTVMPLLNLLATASAAAKPLDVNKAPVTTPFIPPNLDLANLSTVFEALTNLQKMSSINKTEEQLETGTSKLDPTSEVSKSEPPKPEMPRVRDPRLRNDGASIESHRRSTESQQGIMEGPSQSDVDLRLKSVSKPRPPNADVDLRSLPFKPVQHSAASEIDASLSSHSPITWHLVPTDVIKADYSNLHIQPKPGVNDPRLRRIVRPPTDELGLPRDPRQRLLDEPVRDPRAHQPLLPTPIMPPTPLLTGPPTTPRYDEDHRPQFYRMDSDMRQFPPPTPRLEEEVYTPGPSRPVDPRQRNIGFDDPRRKKFPGRPDDIDLRPQIAHRVPFINFNK